MIKKFKSFLNKNTKDSNNILYLLSAVIFIIAFIYTIVGVVGLFS